MIENILHKIKRYGQLGVIMLLAYLSVQLFTPEIFIADTPEVRSDLSINTLFNMPKNVYARILNRPVEQLAGVVNDVPIYKIAEATYTEKNPDQAVTYIDSDKMKVEVFWVTTDKGNRMPLLVPKGQKPSQSAIDDIKKNY